MPCMQLCTPIFPTLQILISSKKAWPQNTSCVYTGNFPHLEEESITQWVAEAEDKVFLGVFGNSLHYAVFNPECMFGNTVVVNSRSTVRLVQEERASFKNVEEEINVREEKVPSYKMHDPKCLSAMGKQKWSLKHIHKVSEGIQPDHMCVCV